MSFLILSGSADFKRSIVIFAGYLFTEVAYLRLCYFGPSIILLLIVLPIISFAKNSFLSSFLKFYFIT